MMGYCAVHVFLAELLVQFQPCSDKFHACSLREAVDGSQQLPLLALQLLPGPLLLQHLLLLYLTQHHLSPAGIAHAMQEAADQDESATMCQHAGASGFALW